MSMMSRLPAACVLSAILLAAAMGSAVADGGQVVVLSKGGSYQDAQRKNFFQPFTAETGIKVVEASGVDFPRVRTMIQSGNPQIDIIDSSAQDLEALTRLGLLQKIDYATTLTKEEQAQIDPKLHDDYAVPSVVWSMILAYNKTMYPTPPQSWADFWDIKKFPGGRTSQGTQIPPVEQAAFAMGVAPDKIYTTPIDSMMQKIKSLGSAIAFTTTPAMVQMLATGEVGMAITSNGRVQDLQRGGKPIAIQWNQGILNVAYLVIPKGAPDKENALKLIEFMSRAKPQAGMATASFFGPSNLAAYDYIDASVRDALPTSPSFKDKQVVLDAHWWGENRVKVTEAWNQIVLGQ